MLSKALSSLARPVSRSVGSVRYVQHLSAPSTLDSWARYPSARLITYDLLKPKTLNPRANSILVDVRGPDEVEHGMIPSAVHIPITNLEESLKYPPEVFQERYGIPKPSKDQEITFYCKKGLRSTMATEIALRHGFTNIINYRGSWIEWSQRENNVD
ncbi:hypothetical protein E1B28_010657 [Marasmius oreades]|uniref:Rhodanese domain-containing protein n=1 Tax=Marasmius oreades TaxID=181124 RepID=A0A9P7USX3_9AGAR|nr:uncharacterized protein E1B28_010657 [Marasmius oreades]KAG7091636.1 hypothetical protein E1B28_010657 [Marasmius oreades]